MPLTKIEEKIASALGDSTLFLVNLKFLDGQMKLRVDPKRGRTSSESSGSYVRGRIGRKY